MHRATLVGVALALVSAGCAHDSEGRWVRTGRIRFDARSVSGPGVMYSLGDDGTWAGMGGDRYVRDGDAIRKVGAFGPTPSIIRPSGEIRIERRPDGLVYTPSYLGAPIWTFVTEDGRPIPQEMEIPLYLTARLGLDGAWINQWTPGSELAGIPLESDCGVVLFDLQGRQVAGWVANQGETCPAPRYPGRDALARVVTYRNEVWESPARPGP